MFVLSLEGQLPLTDSQGISVFARDQMRGWFFGLWDRPEYGVEHRHLFGAGIYF